MRAHVLIVLFGIGIACVSGQTLVWQKSWSSQAAASSLGTVVCTDVDKASGVNLMIGSTCGSTLDNEDFVLYDYATGSELFRKNIFNPDTSKHGSVQYYMRNLFSSDNKWSVLRNYYKYLDGSRTPSYYYELEKDNSIVLSDSGTASMYLISGDVYMLTSPPLKMYLLRENVQQSSVLAPSKGYAKIKNVYKTDGNMILVFENVNASQWKVIDAQGKTIETGELINFGDEQSATVGINAANKAQYFVSDNMTVKLP